MRVNSVIIELLLFSIVVKPGFSAQSADAKPEPAALVSLQIMPQDVMLLGTQASRTFSRYSPIP